MPMVFKKNTYKIFLLVNLAFFILTISGCMYGEYNESITETEISETEETSENTDALPKKQKNTSLNIGENLPITRGLAAKMVALTFGTVSEIDKTERTIQFSDTSTENKLDK